MKRVAYLVVTLSLVTEAALYSWPWSRDMFRQPSKSAYEPYGLPPQESVPRGETTARISSNEQAIQLVNPVEPDEASLARGKSLFETYCAVCHGVDANGMGPVSKKFIPPPNITSDYYRGLPDGHFYFVMKHGGAIMPSYAESLGERDIWDVVNHIRELQKSGH